MTPSAGRCRSATPTGSPPSRARYASAELIDIRGADGRTRSFTARTYADWVALLDLALAAVGDPRRLVALAHDAVARAVHRARQGGWAEASMDSGAPVEVP